MSEREGEKQKIKNRVQHAHDAIRYSAVIIIDLFNKTAKSRMRIANVHNRSDMDTSIFTMWIVK